MGEGGVRIDDSIPAFHIERHQLTNHSLQQVNGKLVEVSQKGKAV